MSEIPRRLEELLEKAQVEFEIVEHRKDHTASQTAWDTHTPYHAFAKTVFVEIDGQLAQAVLPADDFLSERKLALALHAGEVKLANERQMAAVCPDCEVGAEPPFGNLYGLPVYVSLGLGDSERIAFNAGDHRHAMRMRYRDFMALSEAQVVPLARHD
jgi:Ala-tRNA(Pro) deacylase